MGSKELMIEARKKADELLSRYPLVRKYYAEHECAYCGEQSWAIEVHPDYKLPMCRKHFLLHCLTLEGGGVCKSSTERISYPESQRLKDIMKELKEKWNIE